MNLVVYTEVHPHQVNGGLVVEIDLLLNISCGNNII